MASLLTFFIKHIASVVYFDQLLDAAHTQKLVEIHNRCYFDLVTYFRAFSNIFSNILTALSQVYFGGPRNVGSRI